MVECCLDKCRWVEYPGSGDNPCPTCTLNARAARASKVLPSPVITQLLADYCTAAEHWAGVELPRRLALENSKAAPEETVPSEVPGGAASPSGAELEETITSSSSSSSSGKGRRRPLPDSSVPSNPSEAPVKKRERKRKEKKTGEKPPKIAPSPKADSARSRKPALVPRQPAGPPPPSVRTRVEKIPKPSKQESRFVARTAQAKFKPEPRPSSKRGLAQPPEPRGAPVRRVRDRSPTPYQPRMGSEAPREEAAGGSHRGEPASWEGHPQGWWQGRSWEGPGSWSRSGWGSWSSSPTWDYSGEWGGSGSWGSRPQEVPATPEPRGEVPPSAAEFQAERLDVLARFSQLFPEQAQALERAHLRELEEERRAKEWPSPGETGSASRRSQSLGVVRPRGSPSGKKGEGGKASSSRSSGGKGVGKTTRKGHPIWYPAGYRNWVEVAFALRDNRRGETAADGESKFQLGGGWKARQWKDWLRQGVVLPALTGEEPSEEFTRDFPGWEDDQNYQAEKFDFFAWCEAHPQHFEEAPEGAQGAEEGGEEEAPVTPSPAEEPPPRRSAFAAPIGEQELRPGGSKSVGRHGPRR